MSKKQIDRIQAAA